MKKIIGIGSIVIFILIFIGCAENQKKQQATINVPLQGTAVLFGHGLAK